MGNFFKSFFAALLALFVFFGLIFLIFFGIVGAVASKEKAVIADKSVLLLDLSQTIPEQMQPNPFADFMGDADQQVPGLYRTIKLIEHAKTDANIKGIYLRCNSNGNGMAASEELRNALLDFQSKNKWVIAYGDVISEGAYYVASAADRLYMNPKGNMEWNGMASQIPFMKKMLEKLDVEAQIFYAGQFKSATEPLREEKMTAANRLQTTVWMEDVYSHMLSQVGRSRRIDTALLRKYANEMTILHAADAQKNKMVDGLRYDDEVKTEIRKKLGIEESINIRFVSMGKYNDAVSVFPLGKKDKIAVVYAEGDIVYGDGDEQEIGSDRFRKILRKVRMDKNIKGVVLRVNSPGGSSLASEIIWREVKLLREEGKPVVVSMGDLAASGGYYISCDADSIFVQPNTLTGSIGVFGVIPNVQGFLNNKLGVYMDGVKTGPYSDYGTILRPMTPGEKIFIQGEIDSIYMDFKGRVADGRKLTMDYVDTVAQGRVWTGKRAVALGLADKYGSINDAVLCAARMAKVKDYGLREYPEPVNFFDRITDTYKREVKVKELKSELGTEGYKLYEEMRRVKKMTGTVQARLPYQIILN